VSGCNLADLARGYGHRNVHYEPDLEKLPHFLEEYCRDGDLVLFLGAGSIWRAARHFLSLLQS